MFDAWAQRHSIIEFAALAVCLVFVSTGCKTSGGSAVDPGEIKEPTPVLHQDGSVAAHGWARGPLMQYDRSLVRDENLAGLREWEYYAVFAPDFAIGLTLADIGFISFAILTLEDYASGVVHSATMFADATALDFPPTPFEDTFFDASTESVEYRFEEGLRSVTVLAQEDGSENRMEAHLQLVDSRATQSIAVVHRFDEPGQFFYENKRVSMPASGSVQVGDLHFDLPEGSAFAVLDWGRGAWPEDVHWEWGHFAGVTDGRMVGINMGTVFGDDSPGSADALIVDGVLHKMESTRWEYDLDDLLAPWRFTTDDGRLDLTLTPDFDDSTTLNLGPAYVLTRWKVHGEIDGVATLQDGSEIQIEGIRGAAEYVEIIW